MPFGTILDPINASATGGQIVGYTRCGDSALWTGAYLVAESVRYRVTRSADALRLFSLNGTGAGVAAASAVLTQAANPALQSPVPVYQCSAAGCAAAPIRLGIDTPIYLTLYGTGIRNRSSLANVAVTINGTSVPVLYAGPTPGFAGLDQVNVALVLSLRGSGESTVVLTVDGQTSNPVTVTIQ